MVRTASLNPLMTATTVGSCTRTWSALPSTAPHAIHVTSESIVPCLSAAHTVTTMIATFQTTGAE